MRALTAAELLSVWEHTRGRQALRQALDCLACAAPGENWAALPFGQFCRGLFRLRAIMFGPVMPGVVSCPGCGERLEFTFECADIARVEMASTPPSGIRLPSADDLLVARSAAELFSRCALEPVAPSPALIQEASARVAEADPLAETTLDLTCPACGHGWQALLDIVSYLCQEISHEARRLLGEVHRLASVYGWSEQEILSLSPARRQAYLELAGV